MNVQKQDNETFLLQPQTALDHIFLEELSQSGLVYEAYTSSLLSLCPCLQPLEIGQKQL